MNLEALIAGPKLDPFSFEALHTNKFVLIEFSTSWNGASHIMAPVIRELIQQHHDDIKIFKVDIDSESDIAKKLNVTKAPCFQIYHEGKLIDQIEGIVSKKVFLNKIKILLRNYN